MGFLMDVAGSGSGLPRRGAARGAAVFLVLAASAMASLKPLEPRKVISLGGVWQVEHGTAASTPCW
jgi:hypothetical protein